MFAHLEAGWQQAQMVLLGLVLVDQTLHRPQKKASYTEFLSVQPLLICRSSWVVLCFLFLCKYETNSAQIFANAKLETDYLITWHLGKRLSPILIGAVAIFLWNILKRVSTWLREESASSNLERLVSLLHKEILLTTVEILLKTVVFCLFWQQWCPATVHRPKSALENVFISSPQRGKKNTEETR